MAAMERGIQGGRKKQKFKVHRKSKNPQRAQPWGNRVLFTVHSPPTTKHSNSRKDSYQRLMMVTVDTAF